MFIERRNSLKQQTLNLFSSRNISSLCLICKLRLPEALRTLQQSSARIFLCSFDIKGILTEINDRKITNHQQNVNDFHKLRTDRRVADTHRSFTILISQTDF